MPEVYLKNHQNLTRNTTQSLTVKRRFHLVLQDTDEERKQRYIARHGATQTFKDIEKPQTWARYILWEQKTIPKAVKNMEKKFNIDIKIKK